jgi:CRP/FNR family transcriptional regulator
MVHLLDHPAARRTRAINLAARPTARCGECDARHNGLCDALDDDDIAFLARVAERVRVPAGALIIEEGEAAGSFFNINKGLVRLFKALPDGRRQIIGFAGAGHFLGLVKVAADPCYAVSAEAMQPVELCRFNRASLAGVFATFPALEHKLLEAATHELVLAQSQMLLLGRKTAAERIASFLLAWAERADMCAPDGLPPAGATLHLPLSRGDLADYLGLTIETVSRAIGQLKRERLIGVPNIHDIVLLQPAALAARADAAI